MSRTEGPGDDYEAKYMADDGVVLRDKLVKRTALVLPGLMALWCGTGSVLSFLHVLPKSSTGVALFLAFMTAFFVFVGMTFSVVRIQVSEKLVHVQYGMWGPRVAADRILRARVVPYDWKKFGGWGIKRSSDGTWAYVVSSGGNVVELTWKAEDGTEEKALFSAADPAAVAAAIERVRVKAARTRVGDAPVETEERKRVETEEEDSAGESERRRARE